MNMSKRVERCFFIRCTAEYLLAEVQPAGDFSPLNTILAACLRRDDIGCIPTGTNAEESGRGWTRR